MKIERGKVYLGDVAATDIAAVYGTPIYVIEPEVVKAQYQAIIRSIQYRPLVVHYACKANANVQVMRFLRELGAALDACSPGDLAFGAAAGYPPKDIFYTGNSVSDHELRLIADARVLFNADSLSALERFGRIASGSAVGLRINCGVVAGFHPHVQSAGRSSKFGIHPGQLDEARMIATTHGLRLVGLHAHLGSDIFDIAPPLEALDLLIEISHAIPDLEFIDVGGGWGVPFAPGDAEFDLRAYGEAATARMSSLSRVRGRPISFRVEPGAYLMSDAGALLARITDLKPSIMVDDSRTPSFAGTDTSYNHCISAVLYGSYHRILVADRADAPATNSYHVAGNLMQAGDLLAKDRSLPELHLGDLLLILNCGSYTFCRATTFNERPRPAEVYASAGKLTVIRRAETIDDLLALQIL